MIVGKFAHRPVLRNQDDPTAGSGLNLIEDNDDDGSGGADLPDDQPGGGNGAGDGTHADDTNSGDEDRGDRLDGDPDPETLRDIAGGDPEGGAPAAGSDPEGGAHGQGNRVPQARLNEVIAERNAAKERAEAAERELAELKAAKPGAAPPPPTATPAPTPAPFDVKAKERQYAELLADGEFDQAADLRLEINAHIQNTAKAEAKAELQQEAVAATLAEVATQAVKDFPYLDTDDGGPAMAAIMAERNRLYRTGVPLADALRQAVDKLAPRLAPDGFQAPARNTDSGSPPGKGSTKGAQPQDTRTPAARARGAAVSGQQPPPLKGGQGNGGTPTGIIDVEDMSEEQFDAMTPEEKRAARGD